MSQTKKDKEEKRECRLERWYYDACALDSELETYDEILNKNHPVIPVVSHLALGEAYGNCFKDGKKKDAPDAFISLINSIKEPGKLEIIGNDDVDEIFEEVRNEIPSLSSKITDSMHIATAIKNQCNVFRTIDSDLCKLSATNKEKIRLIAKKYINNFSITRVGKKK